MASTPNIKTTDFAAPDTWRARLLAGQKTLIDAFFAKPDTYTSQFLRERSRLVDDLLKAIWHSQNLPPDWSLIAVGGYGRGELFPASDIDILIFLPHPPQAGETEQLNHLIGLFWDAGLEIAHSVRTQNDCLEEAAHDITVQTALLESRLLTGDPARFGALRQALKDHLDPIAFFKAKRAEQAERHAHFEDTAYSLEPNCKESPGGLRDLQVILWIAQAAGIGNTWQALEEHGLLTHEECIKTEKNEQILSEIRIRLHLIARRREDRLLFDYQNTLAHQFGLSDTAHKRASEAMMHRYYSAAKTVSQLNTILLQNIGVSIFPARARDAVIQPINERFRMHGELLDAIDESIFKQHKPAILEAFWLMQQNPKLKGMTARTLRALWRARLLIDHDFRRASENRARFLSLFQSEQGVVHEFRRMNQYDILGRYLPVFGHIVGQMQHDLFHVFTVDQHILQVLRNLRRLILPEFMHEYPLASRLIADFDKPWLLYIAALFHDIAKGRGGDHSQLGAKDARRFCIQHGLDPEDRELVVWLVKEHLTFSAVAQKQDISDPQVIASFAAQVGDERRLVALYLLTVADIRGTSPKVWSAWKSRLLDSLYASMHHYFQRDNVPPAHGVIHERQQEALGLLRNFALPDTVHERLWKHLDTAYFLRHEAEEMAWHVQSLHYRTTIDRPVVKARVNPHGTGLQVLVYTRDQRDLFARIVGFFARAGFSIADAKIYTTAHGYALDSFVIFDYRRQDDGPDMTGYIEQELSQRLLNQTPPESPPDIRLSRQVRHLPIAPQVQIESDEHHRYHVMTIVAADRPGLLFSVANTLARHGITLHTAKITTLGERAEDVFLLSGDDLGSSPLRLNLENEILDALKL